MNEYLWPHARTLPVRRDRTLRWTFSFFCFGSFFFFGLNCPAVAFGHFSLFLVEFVLLFMLYFFFWSGGAQRHLKYARHLTF